METLAKRTKLHYGWIVVLVTFFTLIVSAGIRSVPSSYSLPFLMAGFVCMIAAIMAIRKGRTGTAASA